MTSERTLEAAPVAGGRVSIFDTTLRDGEQSPGCRMNLGEKLRMARQPERLQVDVIEGRSPVAPPGDALQGGCPGYRTGMVAIRLAHKRWPR